MTITTSTDEQLAAFDHALDLVGVGADDLVRWLTHAAVSLADDALWHRGNGDTERAIRKSQDAANAAQLAQLLVRG